MRVCVDGQCLSAAQVAPASGRFAWQMIAAFARSSAGVEMETLTFDPEVAQALRLARIRGRKIELPAAPEGLSQPTYAQRVNAAFRAAWLDSPADIILLPDLISPEVALIEPFGGVPIVAILTAIPGESPHPGAGSELAMSKLERLREANAWFLVTSLLLRDWLSIHVRVPAERIETLPPPTDLRRFSPSPSQPPEPAGAAAEPFVLTCACDETRGALNTVFRAFASLSPSLSRTRLAVAVDMEDRRLARMAGRAAAEEGLAPERWRLVNDDEATMAQLLRSARLFVYPAEADYIGDRLLQALAAGCAVICSDTGALPELAGTAALTGSPYDADDLRDRIGRLLRQHSEREAWAARGPARARKYGDRQCAARLVQAFYQEHREEAPVSGDLRVAYVSPLPPVPTAAALYSRWLASELREYADVDLYASQEGSVDPILRTRFQIFSVDDLPNRYSKYDVVVYHMGAERAHYLGIFDLLRRYPGVVILHDVNLFDFFYAAHLERLGRASSSNRLARFAQAQPDLTGDPFFEEMVYCYGAAGAEAARLAAQEGRRLDKRRTFLNGRITRRSRGVVVHSRWAARQLLENGDASPILALPHGAQAGPQFDQLLAREFRESLRLQGGRLLIGAPGPFDSSWRLGVLLQAVARLKQQGRRPMLALIGERPADLEAHCRGLTEKLGISREVVWVDGEEPYDAFLSRLAAVDVVVNLRCPTSGEMPGLTLTALGLGKPPIIADTPASRELPPNAALRIKPDDLEILTLSAALEELSERPALREAIGQAGRAHIEKVAAWPVVTRRLSQFLYEVARRYRYAPPAE